MPDPRVSKLAQVLVNYSLEIQPGQKFVLVTTPLGQELALAVYEEGVKAGANVYLMCDFPQAMEIFLKNASDEQLQFVSPFSKLITETFDARLSISAQENTRALSATDPTRQALRTRANRPIMQTFMERTARRELRWCYTEFPTQSSAQEAEMSLRDYQDFVFSAGKLDQPDPVAAWRREGQRMQELLRWLAEKEELVLKGPDVDLRMSVRGRTFVAADGHENFPDGEIFTGPVEDSVNGWIRYKYPAIYSGREVVDVELWFEDGKVVKEKAGKGEELLTSLLNTDSGARYLGEIGIGTNYDIPRFTKNMLFDEKLGGTVHLAVGASYPVTGGKNDSGLHWDMLCDMSGGEIHVDGELFYKDGKPVMW
jgi:aminopeptidase